MSPQKNFLPIFTPFSYKTTISSNHISAPIINATWGSWSPWSECSASCGDSIQKRYRFCENSDPKRGVDCKGNMIETKPCIVPDCSGTEGHRRSKFWSKFAIIRILFSFSQVQPSPGKLFLWLCDEWDVGIIFRHGSVRFSPFPEFVPNFSVIFLENLGTHDLLVNTCFFQRCRILRR